MPRAILEALKSLLVTRSLLSSSDCILREGGFSTPSCLLAHFFLPTQNKTQLYPNILGTLSFFHKFPPSNQNCEIDHIQNIDILPKNTQPNHPRQHLSCGRLQPQQVSTQARDPEPRCFVASSFHDRVVMSCHPWIFIRPAPNPPKKPAKV